MKYNWSGSGVALTLLAVSFALTATAKPNVLFIAVDDLRPELGCYGHTQIKSPQIDRLAAGGLLFNRAYCQFALCNPSRASLLSGRRPETLRVFTLANFVRDQNPDVVTLPQLFKQHGYQTRSYGKIFHAGNGNHDDPVSWSVKPWHNARDDAEDDASRAVTTPGTRKKAASAERDPDTPDHSDEFPYEARKVEDGELIDGQIANRAVTALRELRGSPFFLAVGFIRPHLPFVAPKKYWDLYDVRQIKPAANPFLPEGAPLFASNDSSELRRYKGVPPSGLISEAEAVRLVHGYYACVSYVDTQVGRVLAELERLNLRTNTVVVLWGDHGYQLGEHGTWTKRTNWEVATRVPLIISAPGQRATGKTDALIEFVDIYPTLAELCALPLPPKLEGTSFVPLLENPARSWKKAAFSIYTKTTQELGRTTGVAMRTDRYRLIEWTGTLGTTPVYELYDHQMDPQENRNVAALPQNRDVLKELTRQLRAGWRGALPGGE